MLAAGVRGIFGHGLSPLSKIIGVRVGSVVDSLGNGSESLVDTRYLVGTEH